MKTLVQKAVQRIQRGIAAKALANPEPFVTKQSAELSRIFDCVREPITRVEDLVLQQVEQFDPGVRSYITYTLSTHGKRIRPALVYFSAGACGRTGQEHDQLALVLELIHLATLVHDDIIDEASIRRGQPTVQRKWGSETAVLIGDSIFAHALMEATGFSDNDICRQISFAAKEVCQGEILQTQRRFDYTMTITEYFRLIEMKTGALFRASTELAARLSGGTPAQVVAMRDFGTALGIAYQVWDDCVDIYGHENEIGKSLGTDLDKGKLTLPILIFLKGAAQAQQDKVRELMLLHTPQARGQLTKMIHSAGAFDQSIQSVLDHLQRASESLGHFTDSEYKASLIDFIDYLRTRALKLQA